MKEYYQRSESMVGLTFFFGALTYIILCPVVIWIAKKSKAYKKLLFLGTFIIGSSLLIIGPSFGIQKSIYFPYFAMFL